MLVKHKSTCGYLMTELHFSEGCALCKYCMYLDSSDKKAIQEVIFRQEVKEVRMFSWEIQ